MSASARGRRPRRQAIVLLEELSTTRTVLEVSPLNAERRVTLDIGKPLAVPVEVVGIDRVAAVVVVLEMGQHAMTVTPVQVVTRVQCSAVHETPYRWADLDSEMRKLEQARTK